MSRRRFLGLTATGVAVAGACSACDGSLAAAERFAFANESPPADGAIEAYTTTPSVERGRILPLHVSSTRRNLRVEIRRVGWPAPTLADSRTVRDASVQGPGLPWPVTVEFDTTEFRDGLYFAEVRPTGQQLPVRYVPFVVRDPASVATVAVHVPFLTYQAYNAWGGASLYEFNSNGRRAASVGLHRPYDVFDGAGFLFYGDYQLAMWLDREGRDVTYLDSQDLDADPDVLRGRRLFVSAFHDEYWTETMRDRLVGFLATGGNAAFLGANSIYWRVEIDGDRMRCEKAGRTGRFRDVGQPESDLLGSWYDSHWFPYGRGAPWRALHTDHWIYVGTGMTDGDAIAGLIGYEWDQLSPHAPPGTTMVSSTVVEPGRRHEGVVVEHPSGATVVNVGTTYWPRFLTGGGPFPADGRVQRMTRNVLDRLS